MFRFMNPNLTFFWIFSDYNSLPFTHSKPFQSPLHESESFCSLSVSLSSSLSHHRTKLHRVAAVQLLLNRWWGSHG
ncbi:unnamed protein product [Brassica oleracea]